MAPDPVHWSYHLISTIVLLADLTIRVGLSLRVIMRRRPYPITLAWLVVILLIPFAGGSSICCLARTACPTRGRRGY